RAVESGADELVEREREVVLAPSWRDKERLRPRAGDLDEAARAGRRPDDRRRAAQDILERRFPAHARAMTPGEVQDHREVGGEIDLDLLHHQGAAAGGRGPMDPTEVVARAVFPDAHGDEALPRPARGALVRDQGGARSELRQSGDVIDLREDGE